MGVFEIISAIILIIACVFIVVVILLKDTKTQMSQTLSGTSNDSFFQKNAGRTKEAMLNKATIAAAVIFFALAVAVNLINVYGSKTEAGNTSSSAVTSTDTTGNSSTTSNETSDTSDTSDTSNDAESNTENSNAASE